METVYRCPQGERRFTIRNASNTITFEGGRRGEATLPPAEAERATRALRQLDALLLIIPECHPAGDPLMAFGRIGRRNAVVHLVWTGDRMRVSEPQFIGCYCAEGESGTEANDDSPSP